MEWYPICVFDREPDWKRFHTLHPDACIIGMSHKHVHLWYLDGGLEDPVLASHFPLCWPQSFVLPEEIALPTAYLEFIERAGTVGEITGMFPAGLLRFGAAVATLAGTRTFVCPSVYEPAFDLAYVLGDDKVAAFGAACGTREIIWDQGTVHVKCDFDPYELAEGEEQLITERLLALPYVRLEYEPRHRANEAAHWPKNLWPPAWGNPSEVMGIGRQDESMDWFHSWKYCYDRPGLNAPGMIARLFKLIPKCPFEHSKPGIRVRPDQCGDSGDEED